MRAMLLVLGLAGCAAAVPAPQVAVQGRAGRIAAECRLLEAAHAATRARMGTAPPDILVGCPGHEALRDAMALTAQSAALRVANAAVLPPEVAAAGPQGARLYRRMISRGVPEPVAADVARGPLLAAAVRG
ncbi:hypothetical protein [Gemmobacter sp.]|uniref:hypothetical protein n=1 Tax=Gemmobacter sp. TaxID=1898957 RepID=UPI002AFF53B7|nr:hypothetical protein [Gemmobacter sp.]